MATVVNMSSLLNGKDSRWLQLEVCREFQRNKCSRQDTECKFAHPPVNVEVQNGKVTACYDSIKGRCNRDKPPCKYFHPPQHLKDQLLINGRNHLALKNALMQQMGITPGQPVLPGQVQAMTTNPFLSGIPTNTYSPYFTGHLVPALLGPDPSAVAPQLGPVVPQTVQIAQQKIPRTDRLENTPISVTSLTQHPTTILPTPGAILSAPQTPTAAIAIGQHSLEVGKKRAAENDMLQLAFSGMVPYKRPAAEKSGIPVYQTGANTYQQLMQLQQPFVPVSCEYQSENTKSSTNTSTTATATATTSTISVISTSNQFQLPTQAQPPPPVSTPNPISMPFSTISNTRIINQKLVNNSNNKTVSSISELQLNNDNKDNNSSNVKNMSDDAPYTTSLSLLSYNNHTNNRNLNFNGNNSMIEKCILNDNRQITPLSVTNVITEVRAKSPKTESNCIINESSLSSVEFMNSNNASPTFSTYNEESKKSNCNKIQSNVSKDSEPDFLVNEEKNIIKNLELGGSTILETSITSCPNDSKASQINNPTNSKLPGATSFHYVHKNFQINGQTNAAILPPTSTVLSNAYQSSQNSLSNYNTNNSVSSYSVFNFNSQAPSPNYSNSRTVQMPTVSYTYTPALNLGSVSRPPSYTYVNLSATNNRYFTDPYSLPKEIIHRNYTHSIKMVPSGNPFSGKPLTAVNYSSLGFNKSFIAPNSSQISNPSQFSSQPGFIQATHASAASVAHAQQSSSANQICSFNGLPNSGLHAPMRTSSYNSGLLAHPANIAYMSTAQTIYRPQTLNFPPTNNQYAYLQQQSPNLFYPDTISSCVNQPLTIASVPTANIPSSVLPANAGGAVGLSPYKKMKTS